VIEARKPDLHYVAVRSDSEREKFEQALALLATEYERDI